MSTKRDQSSQADYDEDETRSMSAPPSPKKVCIPGGKLNATAIRNLELLNSNDNYLPIKRSEDLKLEEL